MPTTQHASPLTVLRARAGRNYVAIADLVAMLREMAVAGEGGAQTGSAAGTTIESGTRVYLAARYTRRLELCGYAADLAEYGITVQARWLDGSDQLDNDGRPLGETGELLFEQGSTEVDHYRWKFATDDRDDVLDADVLIAFTERPRSSNSRGGRHVELGIALGAGKRVVVIGPRENVFCWLPEVEHHNSWPEFLMTVRDEVA